MKVVVVEPEKNPVVKEINGSLDSMQNVVGGWIQHIMPWADDVALICNEEGKLRGLPLNRFVITDLGQIIDYIAGTFFICYAPADSENFESLPEELVKKYYEKFKMKGEINEKLF